MRLRFYHSYWTPLITSYLPYKLSFYDHLWDESADFICYHLNLSRLRLVSDSSSDSYSRYSSLRGERTLVEYIAWKDYVNMAKAFQWLKGLNKFHAYLYCNMEHHAYSMAMRQNDWCVRQRLPKSLRIDLRVKSERQLEQQVMGKEYDSDVEGHYNINSSGDLERPLTERSYIWSCPTHRALGFEYKDHKKWN